MISRFKYVSFFYVEEKPKTSVWSCRNNKSDEELGQVRWYAPWRQYCYFPTRQIETVYNPGCLEDICHFIQQRMDDRKSSIVNRK